MKRGTWGWSHTCGNVLPASIKLLFRTQLASMSDGIKFLLFVSVLIKLVPVVCAALCSSPGYILVNSLQRQQWCPWIKQNNLFAKRSLMDGLDSLQKCSSPCLSSLNVSALENKIQRWAWLRAAHQTDKPRLLFPLSLLPQSLRETWLLQGKDLGIQILPRCHCPRFMALPSKAQGLRSRKLLRSTVMPTACPESLHGFN